MARWLNYQGQRIELLDLDEFSMQETEEFERVTGASFIAYIDDLRASAAWSELQEKAEDGGQPNTLPKPKPAPMIQRRASVWLSVRRVMPGLRFGDFDINLSTDVESDPVEVEPDPTEPVEEPDQPSSQDV